MSEIAGRLAVQVGAHYLEQVQGGRGLSWPASLVCRRTCGGAWGGGGGDVGGQDCRRHGGQVTVINLDLGPLASARRSVRRRIATCACDRSAIERAIIEADLVIGAVLVPGRARPRSFRATWCQR